MLPCHRRLELLEDYQCKTCLTKCSSNLCWLLIVDAVVKFTDNKTFGEQEQLLVNEIKFSWSATQESKGTADSVAVCYALSNNARR